ncbi:MAG: Gfo/Idh/MocA family oxidoreductase [Saprospiraceae bacterium]|nr:Gfo/Idh/MocA family oxidoreductase [Saprospiraceae bacterium]
MSFKKIPPTQPIRMAFLGCGNITAKHGKRLQKFADVQCYYASRSEEKAKQFSAKLNGSGHFGSYQAAIASPEIDVVFIATPPADHLELALAAVRAGKHVILEKPPFFKSSDFDLVDAERQKTGVQVMVAENYFYKPLLRKLRETLAADLIGDLKFLFFNATKTQKTGDWRDDESTVGGGALFEGGIHWVNFMSNLGLDVQSVTGFLPQKKKENSLERSMQVVMKYQDGPVGTLLYSWEVNALLKGLRLCRIYGSEGSITFEANGLFIFVRGKKWRLIFPGFSDIIGTNAMFRDFFVALRNGQEPAFNFALAKRDIVFIEAAYRTAGT